MLQIPIFLAEILVERVGSNRELTYAEFLHSYRSTFIRMAPEKIAFWLLDRGDKGYLTSEDFGPLMASLLENYPGLDFLKPTPEF